MTSFATEDGSSFWGEPLQKLPFQPRFHSPSSFKRAALFKSHLKCSFVDNESLDRIAVAGGRWKYYEKISVYYYS